MKLKASDKYLSVSKIYRPFKKVHILEREKVESSAFAFVCLEISNLLKLEISTLLKLENSCLLLFSEGLKFQALEGLKSTVKTDDSS